MVPPDERDESAHARKLEPHVQEARSDVGEQPDDVERGPKERRLADRDRYAAPAEDVNEAGDHAVDVEISRSGVDHR